MGDQPKNKSQQVGSTREAFMARVRAPLGRSETVAPDSPPPAVDESLARLAKEGDDLLGKFAAGAEAVGMHVHRVYKDNMVGKLVELLRENEVKSIAVSNTIAKIPGIMQTCSGVGITARDWHSQIDLHEQFDVDAGINEPIAALAETGTLVCHSCEADSRGLSLVPPLHFAIMHRSRILPDMIDYWNTHTDRTAESLPSSIAFITGPSKTADIEGVLITGVHGPKAVHILLVEDS